MTTRWTIGVASGSSGDGVDAALAEIDGVGLDVRARVVHATHQGYPRDVRNLIQQCTSAAPADMKQVCLLHRLLGEVFAAGIRLLADESRFNLHDVQCIGCPGHAIWHEPEGRFPGTLTVGMAAVVAERTGITTVSDFRARDIAAGGQGVPLTALADYLAFRHPTEDRLLLHLGGIARLVHLPAGGRLNEVTGFEAGPCNLLLDSLMRHLTGGREAYDPGGKNAVQGRCIEVLLERWLSHPYWRRRPPKSLPRNGWVETFVKQAVEQTRQMNWPLHDLLCTAAHLVATGAAQAIQQFLPSRRSNLRVLLSGGGTRNGLLWHLLEQQLSQAKLERIDCLGVSADQRKSLAFGVLAALTMDGVPANVPSATGASSARLLGNLTPGSPTNWARCLSWMASLTQLPAAA